MHAIDITANCGQPSPLAHTRPSRLRPRSGNVILKRDLDISGCEHGGTEMCGLIGDECRAPSSPPTGSRSIRSNSQRLRSPSRRRRWCATAKSRAALRDWRLCRHRVAFRSPSLPARCLGRVASRNPATVLMQFVNRTMNRRSLHHPISSK
jgi:hypothetical protein